jgi:predicted small lipoprotein YifL
MLVSKWVAIRFCVDREKTMLRTLTLMALPLALTGCGSSPLKLKDADAPSIAVRGVKRLSTERGHGIEAQALVVKGEGRQDHPASSSPLRLSDVEFAGPVTVRHEVKVYRGHVAWNQLLFAGRPVEMEVMAGGQINRVTWTTVALSGAVTQPVSAVRTRWGITGGVLGRYNFAPSWSFEAGTQVATGRASGYRHQLALAWQPVPTLRLRLGYAQDSLEVAMTDLQSDLHSRTRGPFGAISFEF